MKEVCYFCETYDYEIYPFPVNEVFSNVGLEEVLQL